MMTLPDEAANRGSGWPSGEGVPAGDHRLLHGALGPQTTLTRGWVQGLAIKARLRVRPIPWWSPMNWHDWQVYHFDLSTGWTRKSWSSWVSATISAPIPSAWWSGRRKGKAGCPPGSPEIALT